MRGQMFQISKSIDKDKCSQKEYGYCHLILQKKFKC